MKIFFVALFFMVTYCCTPGAIANDQDFEFRSFIPPDFSEQSNAFLNESRGTIIIYGYWEITSTRDVDMQRVILVSDEKDIFGFSLIYNGLVALSVPWGEYNITTNFPQGDTISTKVDPVHKFAFVQVRKDELFNININKYIYHTYSVGNIIAYNSSSDVKKFICVSDAFYYTLLYYYTKQYDRDADFVNEINKNMGNKEGQEITSNDNQSNGQINKKALPQDCQTNTFGDYVLYVVSTPVRLIGSAGVVCVGVAGMGVSAIPAPIAPGVTGLCWRSLVLWMGDSIAWCWGVDSQLQNRHDPSDSEWRNATKETGQLPHTTPAGMVDRRSALPPASLSTQPVTGQIQENAYGSGVGMDQYGRPVKYQVVGGSGNEDTALLKVKPDAYGLGVGRDQYGRPVKAVPAFP